MSISIGPNPVLEDLILWYDASNTKCYSGEPTRNQISQDYRGESGLATGNASIDLSGLFGFGLISKEPFAHEVWSLDNINKGKLTRYNSYYFDGINDYLEVADDDVFSFGQDNISTYTSDFSTGVDGWAASKGTVDGNIDSIGGENDNLRLTVNADLGQHYISYDGLVNGATYTVSFDYYIPTQSNLDGVRVGFSGDNDAFGSDVSPTLDQWNSFSGTAKMNGKTQLNIMMQDGGNHSFQDAGGDDVFYIRNVQITEIKDDLPFSVSAWVKIDDAINAQIFGKDLGSSTSREWNLETDPSGYLRFKLRDIVNSVTIFATSDVIMTDYLGEWIHIVATYSGSGPNSNIDFSNAISSGCKLYINGISEPFTATDSASYAGQSNTSQPLWIGREGSDYFEGHIRNVKIFNRKLNSGEVYQLYYSNRLNGVKYSSDFSSGVDGWTEIGTGTVAGNIDSIFGQNDNLSFTVDTTNGTFTLSKNSILTEGKYYNISFDYYMPTQSNVDGFRVGTNNGSTDFGNIVTATLDSWTNFSGKGVSSGINLYISLRDGGAATFQDAGGDDVLYIRNFNVVELDTNSEVDFVDEWGEANGGTYTSDFSAGDDNFVDFLNVTLTGNIDGIGGEDDTLRIVLNTTNGNHVLYKSGLNNGRRHRVSFDYYIPSSNSNVDGFNVALGSGGFLGVHTATLDSWTNYSVEGICKQSSNLLLIYLADGSSLSFQDAGGDDVMYIKNVKITQIGCVADFDLSNYDDNDKITDKSTNKFIAAPQGGALARDRWTPYNLAFGKDKDNNDIATITRDPSSGAFFENTDKLTFYGEYPLYVSNASTGDKVSVSFEAKSNITGLFTGLNFFNSGTSAAERVWLNRILMPDNYEYYYGTSNLIATGDNVGFSILMNRDFSSGWNSISLRKPQIELKDHSTNFVATSRSGVNAIVNLANRSLYTGTITNDVKSSGISKIDGVQSFYPLNGGYWEFNGVDSVIKSANISNDIFSAECVCLFDDVGAGIEALFGFNQKPFFGRSSNKLNFRSTLDGSTTDVTGPTSISANTIYCTTITFDSNLKTGVFYLNGEFDKGFSFSSHLSDSTALYIGDKQLSSSTLLNGKIYSFKYYNRFLTSGEVYRNYRAVKTKYGL